MESIIELSNSLESLITLENLKVIGYSLLKFFTILSIILILIFILLMMLNNIRTYDSEKIWNKRKYRTTSKEIGGGQEVYFKYWLWQRNKRKNIEKAIITNTKNAPIYPKENWRKRGRVKFPLRREKFFIIK